MIVIHSDLTSLLRRSTRTRTVPFDTTHVAKGQGLWLWAERHRPTGAAQRGSARRVARRLDSARLGVR